MGRYRVLTLTQPLSRGVLQHTARAVTGLVLAGLVMAATRLRRRTRARSETWSSS